MKGLVLVDVKKCLGCKSCEIACAVAHSQSKVLTEAVAEDPAPSNRVWVEKGDSFVVPLQCRHCENAPCVAVCPTDALFRHDQESPVIVDSDRCIGCKWCVLACPFGVIRMDDESHVIVKCDQCFERMRRGEPPACVSSCLTGALRFTNMAEVIQEKRKAYLVHIEQEMAGGGK